MSVLNKTLWLKLVESSQQWERSLSCGEVAVRVEMRVARQATREVAGSVEPVATSKVTISENVQR